MTRQAGFVCGILAAVALVALPASAGGDANVLFGQKTLNGSTLDAARVDGQSQFGVAVTLDFEWPVALAFDLMTSSDRATTTVTAGTPIDYTTDVETMEFDVGVRKLWGDRLQPYAGAGLAWLQLDTTQHMSGSLGGGSTFDTLVIDDSNSTIGYWVNGGLLYRIGARFNVGIDVRYSNADVSLTPAADPEPVDLGAGGTQYAVALGFHW